MKEVIAKVSKLFPRELSLSLYNITYGKWNGMELLKWLTSSYLKNIKPDHMFIKNVIFSSSWYSKIDLVCLSCLLMNFKNAPYFSLDF